MRRTPIKRGKSLNPVSKKRRKEAPLRRALVDQHLSITPYCEATLVGLDCTFEASDVHEVIPRGRRPGAHLDPELFVSLCRNCHTWLTGNPSWATRHGYMLSATAGGADIAVAKSLRGRLDCPYPPTQRQKCEMDHRSNDGIG